jgi:WD40 repeat protein
MALSPDARRIATLGYPPEVLGGAGPLPDPVLVIADRATGKTLVRTAVDDPSANGGGGVLSFSPDGRALAVGTYGGVTSIVDSSSGAVLVSRRTDVAAVTALSWSRDGRTLYEGGQDGVVRFLDPQTEDDVATVPLTPQLDLSDMETVPGGGVLAVSSEAGQVSFVDTARREVSGEPLEAEGTQLQAVAISPDGRQVAAVSRDGALRLWDRASGRAVGPPLNAHQFGALPIAYLGGDRLVTAGADSTLVVWNLAPEHWVDRACELAGRDLTRAEWARYLPDQPYRRTCTDR